jgi:hypothetical protein
MQRLIVANRHTCEACIRDAGGTCGAPCPCPADGTSAVIHAAAGTCPKGLHGGTGVRAGGPSHWGPALWAELHTRTDADQAFVDSVTRRLPCGDCRRGFLWFVREYPPVFGEGWFQWAVAAHNYVNTKIGKPTLTADEARARWRR